MPLIFPTISQLPPERYEMFLGPVRFQKTISRFHAIKERLAGRVIWNVSSTRAGGGVAEMVRSLLAYARGAGVDARWAVIEGTPDFFRITKRLHNAIHGTSGDLSPLGETEKRIYEKVNADAVRELAPLVRPRDLVLIHDPQPAGMIRELLSRGAQVIWRCHIGSDTSNAETELGWKFLAPYIEPASAFVFSRPQYIPEFLKQSRTAIIPPSIDPFSAKNQPLSETAIRAILTKTGIINGLSDPGQAVFLREDGTPSRVDRRCEILREGDALDFEVPLVVQVSRWDRLKDHLGVMNGFARLVGQSGGAGSETISNQVRLLLAGPGVSGVADDPEGSRTYEEIVAAWRTLPDTQRFRVQLITIPTVDVDENAAIVNALQRHASIIVQKSLHEGFGLTVTEAMWKARPVIASAVGGIQDQISEGEQGLLLKDPRDLNLLGPRIACLLKDPALARRLGDNGYARVLERYLGIDSLQKFGDLIEKLDG
jgi:trehalose synthase